MASTGSLYAKRRGFRRAVAKLSDVDQAVRAAARIAFGLAAGAGAAAESGGRLCEPAANFAFRSAAVERNVSMPFGTPRYYLPVFFAKPDCTIFCSFS
jgi:hypothetical protein